MEYYKMIDANTFSNLVVTESMDTTLSPIPAGEHPAYIKDQKLRQQKEYWILDVTWVATDQASIDATQRDEPTVRQSIFLDFTPEGALDTGKGKNIQLGKLREAVNQNQKGKAWSPGMLVGASAIINITHEVYKENLQANVKGVAKAI